MKILFLIVVVLIAGVWVYGSQLIHTYIPFLDEFSLWIKICATIGLLVGFGGVTKEHDRDKTQTEILDELKKSNANK